MTNSSEGCDFDDVPYVMEKNLQNVRRDLIMLLDEYEQEECLVCNRLKCRCSPPSSLGSTTDSLSSDSVSSDSAYPDDREHTSMHIFYNVAPPAESLPQPRWPEVRTRNEHSTTNATEKVSPFIKTLNSWVKASIPYATQSNSSVNFPVPEKVLDTVNYSWPPFPMSIWSEETLKETVDRENMLLNEREGDANSSVEAFFKYFSETRGIPSKKASAC